MRTPWKADFLPRTQWKRNGAYQGIMVSFFWISKQNLKTFKNLAEEGPDEISFPANGIKLSNKTKRRNTSQG